MAELAALRDSFGAALVEAGRRYSRLVVFDADVCTSTKTSLFRDAFPQRFFQMGIAEANMVCAAAGMSTLEGIIPWVSTFAVFAAKRALDQVSISVAYPRNNVKINGSYAGIPTGKAGATHQSVQDLAIMRSMPNMTVIAPGDAVEVREAVFAATEFEGPVYLRTTRHPTPIIFPKEGAGFRIGKGVRMRAGGDITIIGTGIMTARALEAAACLKDSGIDARVLHIPTLKPIDAGLIEEAAAETGRIITVENHSVIGGLGGAVCELLSGRAPVPVHRMGFPDCFGESGDNEEIFLKMGLSVKNIAAAAKNMLGGTDSVYHNG